MEALKLNAQWSSASFSQGDGENDWKEYQTVVTYAPFEANRASKDYAVFNSPVDALVVKKADGTYASIQPVTPYTGAIYYDPTAMVYASKSLSVLAQTGSTSNGLKFSSDGTKVYTANASTIYQYTVSTPWDISTGTYATKSLVTSGKGTILSLWFSTDGTKLYVTGGNRIVYRYNLSTAWDLATATDSGTSYSTTTQITSGTASAVMFDRTGKIMYVHGINNTYQYGLTTAWDLTTASYSSKSLSVGTAVVDITISPDGKTVIWGRSTSIYYAYLRKAWDITTAKPIEVISTSSQDAGGVNGVEYSSDGSKVYILGTTNDTIYQYTVDGSPTFTNNLRYYSRFVSASVVDPTGVFISENGDYLFHVTNTASTDYIAQYNLSVPFDITTATYQTVISSINTYDANPSDIHVSSDGRWIFWTGQSSSPIQIHYMTTPWTITTATRVGTYTVPGVSCRGLTFSYDGLMLYVTSFSTIRQYSLSSAWDVSSAVFVGSYSLGFTPYTLSISPSGEYIFAMGASATLYRIKMATPYLISSASSVDSKSLSSQDSTMEGVAYGANGIIYTAGRTNDRIHEFDTGGIPPTPFAYQVGTASNPIAVFAPPPHTLVDFKESTSALIVSPTEFVKVSATSNSITVDFDNSVDPLVAASDMVKINSGTLVGSNWGDTGNSFITTSQEGNPLGVNVKSDGTKFWIIGNNSDQVREYTMSTPGNSSTATHTASYNGSATYGTDPRDINFSADGTKMYILGGTSGGTIYQFTLSTPWDITTATSASLNYSASGPSGPYSFDLSADGTKLYIMSNGDDYLYHYNLSTAWNISTAGAPGGANYYYIGGTDANPAGLRISSDGTTIYWIGQTSNTMYKIVLTTPYYLNNSAGVISGVRALPTSPVYWNFDFCTKYNRVYIVDGTNDRVIEYSTGVVYTTDTVTSVSVSGGDTVIGLAGTYSNIETIVLNPKAVNQQFVGFTESGANLIAESNKNILIDPKRHVKIGISANDYRDSISNVSINLWKES